MDEKSESSSHSSVVDNLVVDDDKEISNSVDEKPNDDEQKFDLDFYAQNFLVECPQPSEDPEKSLEDKMDETEFKKQYPTVIIPEI